MFGKLLFIAGLVSAGLLLLLLNLTTPSSAGAFGIFAIFLLGYVVVMVVTTYGLWFVAKLLVRFGGRVAFLRRTSHVMTLRRSYYYASVIALAPVIIVSLQSVGSVGLYEVVLVVLFVALGCLYVAKRIR